MPTEILTIARQSPWSHEKERGITLLHVPSGGTPPSAAGYSVGTQLIHDDYAEYRWSCVKCGGIKRWFSAPMQIYGVSAENGGAGAAPISATGISQRLVSAERNTFVSAWIWAVDMTMTINTTNDAANYWIVSLRDQAGATLWSMSTATLPDLPNILYHRRRAVSALVSMDTDGQTGARFMDLYGTKILNPGTFQTWNLAVIYSWVCPT